MLKISHSIFSITKFHKKSTHNDLYSATQLFIKILNQCLNRRRLDHFLHVPYSGRSGCFGRVWGRTRGWTFRGKWDTRKRTRRRCSVEYSSRPSAFRCTCSPAPPTSSWLSALQTQPPLQLLYIASTTLSALSSVDVAIVINSNHTADIFIY